jgi:hypothetical protein
MQVQVQGLPQDKRRLLLQRLAMAMKQTYQGGSCPYHITPSGERVAMTKRYQSDQCQHQQGMSHRGGTLQEGRGVGFAEERQKLVPVLA